MMVDLPIRIRVLKVNQKKSEFYIGVMDAKELVEISYADVRRLADEQRDVERYLGIQRPVNPSRITQIKKYLTSPDARFPTGIIVAIDEKCAEFNEEGDELLLRPYVPKDDADDIADDEQDLPIPLEKIAKVLDGQHRLAGFLDEDDNWSFKFDSNGEFELSVVFFVGADLATQAEIFATVNLAQTKVNKSLVYDLQDLAEARSPFKTGHDVAVALDDIESSPFYERIKRLGVRTEGRDNETITQAAFVESLVKRMISFDPVDDRNRILDGNRLPEPTDKELEKRPFRKLFVEKRDVDIIEIVTNYFKAISKKWPDQWDNPKRKGNIVAKSNAFKASMRYLQDIYPEISGYSYETIPRVEDFSKYFDHIELEDEDFNTKNFKYGGSGESVFYRLLTGEISPEEIIEDD